METSFLRLLGPPKLLDPTGRTLSTGTKPLALLIYLALEGGVQPRAKLARMLWPGAGAASARHSLSQAIYALRGCLPTDVLTASAAELTLTQLPSDLEALRKAAAAQQWSKVQTRLCGTLCESFEVPSAEYGLWLDGCRARVHREFMALLPALESACEWDLLLHVTAILGKVVPGETLRPFEATALDAVAAEAPSSRTAFVGRGMEMERFRRLQQQQLTEGGGAVVVLRGPSGIGKTALGSRLTRLSALRGWSCHLARGYAAEKNLAYGVLDQFLRGLDSARRSRLQDLTDSVFGYTHRETVESGISAPEDARLRLFNVTADTIISSAAGRPCLLFVDDYHWADPSSRSFLHYFARTHQGTPHILLLGCGLEGSVSALQEYRGALLMELGGLSLAEITEYLNKAEAGFRRSAELVHRQTGGNPLLVQKIVYQQDQFVGGRSVPVGTTEFFQRQFDRLSGAAQLFLAALSTLGGRGALAGIVKVSGLANEAAQVAQEELLQQRLLDVAEDVVMLNHGLAGDLFISQMDPLLKRELYARAAKFLRDSGGAPPAVIAINLDLANSSSEAYLAANLAAESSIRLAALREAEFFLRLAISHATTDDDEATSRMMLCRLFITLRRVDDAAGIMRWDGWERVSEAKKLHKQVIDVALGLDDSTKVNKTLDTSWDCVDRCLQAGDIPAGVDLLGKISTVAVDVGRQADARRALEILVPLLPSVPPDQALRVGLAAASSTAIVSSLDSAYEIASSLSHAAEAPIEKIRYFDAVAVLHFMGGGLREAEQHYLLSLQWAEKYGIYSHFFQSQNNLGVCYIEMGKYDEGERHLVTALEYCQREPYADRYALIVYDNLSILEYERGGYQQCLAYADKSSGINLHVEAPRSRHAVATLKGLASLELGQLSVAFECDRQLRAMRSQEPITSDPSYAETFSSRMHQLRGEEEKARRVLEEGISALRHTDFFGRARLRLELAKLHSRVDPEQAVRALRQLVDELDGTGAEALLSRANEMIRAIPS